MKGKILQMLRERDEVISGEAIRADLGISRVAVWKHVRKLQELGYPIASTGKGYRLTGDVDALFAWEFPGRESRIRFVAEATSTMDIARELARKGWPDRGVVVAQTQSAGRGRLKRHWLSDEGGLFFTLIFRPTIPPVFSYRYLFAASLMIARTLTALYDIPARVKWPNDVLVDGKKICGMLAEMEAEADLVTYLNIGIGINVNNDPSDREAGATSVRRLIGRPVSRRDLLTSFLDRFEARIDQNDLDGIVAEWTSDTVTLNRPVRIVTGRETTEGMAVDVDENGALKVKLDDGSIKTVIYGDCFHIRS